MLNLKTNKKIFFFFINKKGTPMPKEAETLRIALDRFIYKCNE